MTRRTILTILIALGLTAVFFPFVSVQLWPPVLLEDFTFSSPRQAEMQIYETSGPVWPGTRFQTRAVIPGKRYVVHRWWLAIPEMDASIVPAEGGWNVYAKIRAGYGLKVFLAGVLFPFFVFYLLVSLVGRRRRVSAA